MGTLQPQVTPERPQVIFPEIADIPKLFRTCIQCGVCSGSCPRGEFMDYPPAGPPRC
jgi:heterodisulfide reductase subunit C